MKIKSLLTAVLLFGLITLLSAQTLNYPPSCVITMPYSNAYFKAGTDVEIHVYATDIGKSINNGTVTKVEFFNGNTLLGEATTHNNYTYKFVWSCVPAGTYTLKARATNNRGVTFTSVGVVINVGNNNVTQRGMSACKGKYLANIIPSAPQINYNTYWNGVTAENSCKWGPVESTRDVFNWSGADVAYNHAKNNNLMFRYHALIWASQYPNWFTSLSPADARAEALEYMTAVAQRFPLTDQVDVINEQLPGHQAANPTFASLLGGTGSTGYDWQIWVFTQARALFPNSKLILNDYGLENNTTAINNMLGLVRALRDRGLIDGFGTQAHCFNVDQTSANQLKAAVDLMATSGIPVYVTELDLNGGVDSENNAQQQLASYQTHFPIYWDHPAVAGITLWGYITGATWKTGTGLMSSSGVEKPAFTWLKNYVTGKTDVGYPACATTGCSGDYPTISLTAPANNAAFAVGANIELTANATDTDGNVTLVEFFNGTTRLGQDATSPYSYNWQSVPEGAYTITAVATDNQGNKTTSSAINIVVGNPRTPKISNGEFDNGTAGWDIQNNNSASGTMTVVNNGNLSGTNSLRICPATPGTADWHVQVRQNLAVTAGKNYQISFMAKADAARTITISIQQEGTPWTTHYSQQINLTSTAQTFNFEFNPAVSDATSKLKFYVGGNSTCVLIDKISVTEANFVLAASISAQSSTTICSGESVVLNANSGTDYTYQWKRNDNNIATATTSAYTVTESGSYTVTITASGQTATSQPIEVTVNSTPDAPSPTSPVIYCMNDQSLPLTATGTALKWYSTATGGTASANAPVPATTASGTTNYYVSQTINNCESSRKEISVTVNPLPQALITAEGPVTFIQGGSVVLNAGSGAEYTYKWYNGEIHVGSAQTFTASTSGDYKVEITDANGCMATSAATKVTVNPNRPSQVRILSPAANSSVQAPVTITADASDPDGSITLIEFLDGNTVIGSITAQPYTFTWENPSDGFHEISVRVTDSNGGITTSPSVIISTGTITSAVSAASNTIISTYPNPAKGELTVQSATDLSNAGFRMVNTKGETVPIRVTTEGKTAKVNISGLADGSYLLLIQLSENVISKPITVIK